jgi:hypothetical protein
MGSRGPTDAAMNAPDQPHANGDVWHTMLDRINGALPSLMWSEAIRAALCMLPMFVYLGLGETTFLVALGQGGFFFSSLWLSSRIASRFVMGTLLLTLSLGFYLIGGTVAPDAWVAIPFMFLVCITLSFLSGWTIGGPLALTMVMIFTAGLNSGSPEMASANFAAFAFVFGWSTVISLLPFWQATPTPKVDSSIPDRDLAEQGLRMAIGTSVALAVSYAAGFAKLGWASSAVGNITRFDPRLSEERAMARLIGTLAGAAVALIALALITSVTVLVVTGGVFAILNGLFKRTRIDTIPLFYTATVLLLFSANDLSSATSTVLERVLYNVVGIVIAVVVVVSPFPRIMQRVNPQTTVTK